MCGVLTLESTVLEYDGPGYVKKNCLYYKEGLQNISKAAILQNRLSLLVRKTDQVEPDSYVVNLQGSKRDRDSEEEDDTEDQTITGEKNRVIQMLNDITEEEKETANNIEQEIKSLLHERIRVTLCKSHIELMEDTNLLLESISEGTYIVSVQFSTNFS
ncbi:unnamed protein product [Rhizophagus irregularis]|nr:unnamed protein product [Rhizophagus irregularis]